jgi:hypothetical protein
MISSSGAVEIINSKQWKLQLQTAEIAGNNS